MSSDHRKNLLRLMKLDDYISWIIDRLEVNINEYNSNNSESARRRIGECIKMRDDFQRQHDELLIRMSSIDNDKSHVGQPHLSSDICEVVNSTYSGKSNL